MTTDTELASLRHTDCDCCEVAAPIIESLRATVARQKVALELIAHQRLSANMFADERDDADFEGAYDEMIRAARAALKGEG